MNKKIVTTHFSPSVFLALFIIFSLGHGLNSLFREYLHVTPGIPSVLPEEWEANPWSVQNIGAVGDKYFFKYKFLDQHNREKEWQWSWGRKVSDSSSEKFGVPADIFTDTSYQNMSRSELEKIIKEGFFTRRGKYLVPDMSALANYYRPLVAPLYQKLYQTQVTEDLTPRQKVNLLLRFLQDIPYGLPPDKIGNRYIHGLFPPTISLEKGYGDCDTKSLIFASVLANDSFFKDRIIFIYLPKHMLVGVRIIPQPYDNFVTYHGEKYVVAEPVGLNRSDLGTPNQNYRTYLDFEKLKVEDSIGRTYQDSSDSNITGDSVAEVSPTSSNQDDFKQECTGDAMEVSWVSPISKNKTVSCQKKTETGKFVKHGPETVLSATGKVIQRKIYSNGTVVNEF